MGWKEHLIAYTNPFGTAPFAELADSQCKESINEYMQRKYPGKYTIEEIFDTKRMCFSFKLVFSDPQEETMWMLKWSDK
jgi:hypothetical protein